MNNPAPSPPGTQATAQDSATIKRALLAVKTLQGKLDALERARTEPIALVGVGCRFPQAAGPDEFWRLLAGGRDAVTQVPAERWDIDAYYDPDPEAPGKISSRWGAFVDGVDQFDAEFFGISPREAAVMDPQQRLFLEVVWQALEDAGQAPDGLAGTRTGVFLGISTSDYGQLLSASTGLEQMNTFSGTGNAFSTAAGRVSYVLGLEGPNLAIDTACSSSLVAVHLACQSLRARESDIALAGGVNLMLSPSTSVAVSKYHALSADGRCKAFDASANGFVRGEGCGVVVCKRLSDALANRDRILAVIRGSAINQDGRSSGMTAPNVLAQQAVIRAALERAGASPAEVSFIEAHGTGTSLGDPIEVAALGEVYGGTAGRDGGRCAIGSVKANVGHLEASAGVAGLIKLALALHHQAIPAQLHFRTLNPRISLDGTPLFIPTALTPWPRGARPRLGAVSSFGLSGTNAHAVVEEAPARAAGEGGGSEVEAAAPTAPRPASVFTLSARTDEALRVLAQRFERHLAENQDVDLANLCFTVNTGRARFPHRLALVARSKAQLRADLARAGQGGAPASATRGPVTRLSHPRVAFLFTGQGAAYPGMGRQLFDSEPTFRRALERCDGLARPALGCSLIEAMAPGPDADAPLHQPLLAAPVTFAIQHALVELWRSWGIQPAVVLGHSVGEYAAAWAAGVFSLEEGLRLVIERAKLLAGLCAAGGMATVHAERPRIEELLRDFPGVVVAAHNGAANTVISGAAGPLAQAVARLRAEGVSAQPLPVPQGYHSPLVDELQGPFEAIVAGVKLARPNVTYISGVTGAPADDEPALPGYWRRHLREPVRFHDAVTALQEQSCDAHVEIGPAPVLLALAERTLRRPRGDNGVPVADGGRRRGAGIAVPSLARNLPDGERLARSLAELFLGGIDVDWPALDRHAGRRRLALPTYPFERKRHWFIPASARAAGPATGRPVGPAPADPLLGRRVPLAIDQVVFETGLGATALPFLVDHRVYDRIVVPAAAHLALALAAAAEVLKTTRPVVEGVMFEEALTLEPDEPPTAQVVLAPAGPGRHSFRVVTPDPSDGARPWRQHAVGQVSAPATVERPARTDLGALRARLPEQVDVDDYYARLREVGVDLGEQFRGITALVRGEREALGTIALPPGTLELGRSSPAHPVVIDACLQLFGAVIAAAEDQQEVYLPMAVDRIEVHGPADGLLYAHATLNPRRSPDVLDGAVQLHAADGALVLRASGVMVRRAPRALFLPSAERCTYELAWRPAPVGAPGPAERSGGQWLIFADSDGVAEQLARRLVALGGSCLLVSRGDSFGRQGDRATIDPGQLEHYEQLWQAVGPAPAGVVHLWALDVRLDDDAGADQLRAGQRLAGESALLLLRALDGRTGPAAPALTLVTRGACPGGGGGAAAGLAQAGLWGLRRVVGLERPALACSIVDLEERDPDAVERLLEHLTTPAEREVAYRGGQRLVPVIVPAGQWLVPVIVPAAGLSQAQGAPIFAQGAPIFTPSASYLVTGGLGALGLAVARWAAACGARSLVLAGRSGASPAAASVLEQIRGSGTEVTVVAADVSKAADVERLLAAVRPDAPLRGVFHAAGVLDDGLLEQQLWPRFERVLAAKVLGAWHLHRATRGLALDHFVLFSSLAGVLGLPGQANYAAANAALDALAHHRRAAGLPALAVDWGPWAQAGMAAVSPTDEQLRTRRGIAPIEPGQALAALERLLAGGPAQALVANVDWPRLAAAAAGALSPSLLQQVLPRARAAGANPTRSFRDELQAAPPERRPPLLRAHLRTLVGVVLGVDQLSAAQEEQSFTEMGMNSLMFVELRNQIESGAGCQVPATAIFNYPTLDALAEHLLREVLGLSDVIGTAGATAASLAAPQVSATATAAARIAELSEAEVESLLMQTLDQIQGSE